MRSKPSILVATILLSLMFPWTVGGQEEEAKGPRVGASAICRAVDDHQPVDEGTTFGSDVERLSCWTRILDAKDKTIVHAWIHEGVTRARVELRIGSPSWRTYSTKKILPSWTGAWEVKIMTLEGLVLETITFHVE